MTTCDWCGRPFDELGYQVIVPLMSGRFHSLECAERAYRRFQAEQNLILTHGLEEAERILRVARGDPAPEPDGALVS